MGTKTIMARVLMACAVPMLLSTGCAGDDSGSTAATTASPAEVQAVATTYERFFDSSLPADQKAALLQNGPVFLEILNSQAHSSMASGASATVSRVAGAGPGRAAVTYTINKDGLPLLPDRQGEAIRIDGTWKVSAASFCSLLQLEGNTPVACNTPTPAN